MSWVPSPHGARLAPLAQRQSVGLMNQKAEDIGQMIVLSYPWTHSSYLPKLIPGT